MPSDPARIVSIVLHIVPGNDEMKFVCITLTDKHTVQQSCLWPGEWNTLSRIRNTPPYTKCNIYSLAECRPPNRLRKWARVLVIFMESKKWGQGSWRAQRQTDNGTSWIYFNTLFEVSDLCSYNTLDLFSFFYYYYFYSLLFVHSNKYRRKSFVAR